MKGTEMASRRVIVPVDDSEHSYRALQFAVSVCKQENGEIVLVNVQPSFSTPNIQRFIPKEEIRAYIQEVAGAILDKAFKTVDKEGIAIEKVIRTGIPKVEITQLAKEKNAYCIIMGSRGIGPVKGAIIGSVSLGVLQLAPCPVTIVP